jgi:hypothetical protein
VNPLREKRKHTGYTLFVQENHPIIKESNPNVSNANVVSIVAKQWRDLTEAQQEEWKTRALTTPIAEGSSGGKHKSELGQPAIAEEGDEQIEGDNEGGNDQADDDTPAPPARKQSRRQKK